MDEDFFDSLYNKVINDYLKVDLVDENNDESINNLELEVLNLKKKQLESEEKVLENIMIAFEKNLYTIEQFADRKPKKEASIKKLKTELIKLEKLLIPNKLSNGGNG